ncbi:MAG: transmembrane 220 family protein, partial [Eudoraea sp.]|nr:transmembrane 220 family protein [Eudoraea sp.]
MSGKRKTVRIIALIFALLFSCAAILQYNDPDPFIWILFYCTAAISCFLFFANRFPFILGILLGLIYFGGAVWVWPAKFEGVS